MDGLSGDHLSKSFGRVAALTDVSLHVARGEVVALIGPNGAGKSTLLSLLAGLLVPDAGVARIDGSPAHDPSGHARRGLGFLAGDTRLYARLTVEETLRFFASLHGLADAGSHATIDARVDETLARFSLTSLRATRCDALSSGQAQRVNLARALVHDPGVVILDEPTTALDVKSQRLVLDFVADARAAKKAVLFSSHVMGEVEAVADRVVVLDRGRVRASVTRAEVAALAGDGGLSRWFDDDDGRAAPGDA